MCWRCSPYLRSSARSFWARSDFEHRRVRSIFSGTGGHSLSGVLHLPDVLLTNAPPLVACERRTAGDLIPILDSAHNTGRQLLVQALARLPVLLRGIGPEPRILPALPVALFDRQARITRFLACRLCHGK